MKIKQLIISNIVALFLFTSFSNVVAAQDNAWIFPGTESKIAGSGFNQYNMYRFGNMQNVFNDGLDSKSLIAMFGEEKVCAKKGGVGRDGQCEMKKEAEAWRRVQVGLMRGRHAEGMIVSAMRSYLESDEVWRNGLIYTYDFKMLRQRNQGFLAERSNELNMNDEMGNYIGYYQTLKELEAVYNEPFRQSSYGFSPMDFVNRLVDSLNSRKDFYTIEIGAYAGRSYRPLLPFEIHRMGTSANYKISVYDANCPETVGFLFIATDSSSKMYYKPCNGRAEDFGGRRTLTPISARFLHNNRKFLCPFGRKSGSMAEGSSDDADFVYFSFNGSGEILITDPNAKQIGYDHKTKKEVNQIADARIIYDDGDADSIFTPRYALPYDDAAKEPYRIVMSGDDLKKESNGNLTVTAPGFVVGFEGISLDPREKLSLSISPDGKTLSFTASADRETPSIFVTTGDGQENPSYSFKIGGVVLEAGKTLTMTVNLEEGKIFVKDNDGKADSYDIDFRRLDPDASELIFVQADVKLKGKDSYNIDISKWDDETKPCVENEEGKRLFEEDCVASDEK